MLYSNLSHCFFALAPIPFKKRSFRQYFQSEENWLEFHQLLSRLLRAQSVEMAAAIQDSICEWLIEVNERRAATWFRRKWRGERGNYTNASAGYVGNKVATSLESK
jgi:hypothetical protein